MPGLVAPAARATPAPNTPRRVIAVATFSIACGEHMTIPPWLVAHPVLRGLPYGTRLPLHDSCRDRRDSLDLDEESGVRQARDDLNRERGRVGRTVSPGLAEGCEPRG